MTVSKFYRPSGASTQKRGVHADVVLPSLSGVLKGIGEEDLEYCIEWDQVQPTRFTNYQLTSPNMLTTLKGNSAARVAQTEKFADIRRVMERYLKQKEEKSVTVHEEKYMARRAELDSKAEEEKLLDEPEGEEEGIVRDYYLDEVFAIGVDYIKLLTQRQTANAAVQNR